MLDDDRVAIASDFVRPVENEMLVELLFVTFCVVDMFHDAVPAPSLIE